MAVLAMLLLLSVLVMGQTVWRLSRLGSAQASELAERWGAEFEPMWPALWRQDRAGQAVPAPDATLRWSGAPGWRLLPRPQLLLHEVRWPVDARLASGGELHIARLTLALEWTSLWAGQPRLHRALAHDLAFRHANPQAGLQSDWQVQHVALGPADALGRRSVDASLDLTLHPLQPVSTQLAPAPAPWLQGHLHAQALWSPARDDKPAQWRQMRLQFQGQLAGQPVPDAQLLVARWQHQPAQQRFDWEDLQLQVSLGEGEAQSRLALRWPALFLNAEQVGGTPATGEWSSLRPFPLKLSLDSGLPRGRYGAVHWPQWRVALTGQNGTRAAGQMQADLAWLGVVGGLRWDGLVGQFSAQPEGQPERQWNLRGQAQWHARAASWQLDGQAHGGAPEQAVWDGPFATQGEWRRWPQPRVKAQLQLATLRFDRWLAASGQAGQPAPWWAGWHRWPGRLDLQVGYLSGLGLRLGNVHAGLDNDGEQIRVPRLSARLWDGALLASGRWTLADQRWALTAQLQDAELAPLREALAQPPATPAATPAPVADARAAEAAARGRWSGQLALNGQAADLAALGGDWSWEARAGHWGGVDLQSAWAAAPADWRAGQAGERTPWRRLRGTGTVSAGVAQGELQLQAPDWRGRARGTLDLPGGELNLVWQASPERRGRPTGLQMSGPWHSPRTRTP